MKNALSLLLLSIFLASNTFAQNLPSAYINVSGAKVYVEGGGTGGGIPVVFVHGEFQDHTLWDAQAKDLMKDHIVILLDLPGHGKTKDAVPPPSAADVIKVVMDSLQINKASVVGSSLGGAVATDFALANSSRINKLVLVSPVLMGWDEGRELDTTTQQYFAQLRSALQGNDTAAAAELFTHNWFDGLKPANTISPLLRDLVFTTAKNTMRQHKMAGSPVFAKPSAINRLPDLTVPTLIISGTLDMPEALLMNGYLANNLPNVRQVMVSGAAHQVNLDKPERFNQEVRKFVDGK